MLKINDDEIKLIITDYDGTLRPINHHQDGSRLPIPSLNVSEIKKAIQQGVYFVLNTGNLPYEMKETIEMFGQINELTKYIIACNGNSIKNYLTNEVKTKVFFNHPTLLQFLEIFQNIGGLSYDITSEDLEFIYYNNHELREEMINLHLHQDDQLHRLNLTAEVLKNFKKCPKITLKRIKPEVKKTILDDVKKNFSHLNISATWFMDNGVDFQIQGPNKFSGIQDLLTLINQEKNLNLTLNNVLYFGDQQNDFAVFENLKYAVAVENATDEIKTLAYEITASATDAGVGKYLQKITC